MSKEEAEIAGKMLGLPEDAVMLLQYVPYKGSLPTAVPTDPLIYRFYEMVMAGGPPCLSIPSHLLRAERVETRFEYAFVIGGERYIKNFKA